jgi:hypothetical protein
MTRPVIQLEDCTRTWARTFGGRMVDRAFTVFSTEAIVFQLLGDPGGSLTVPFAMASRIFADQRLGGNPAPSDGQVNGLPARVRMGTHGAGEVRWTLPDGSEGYLRTASLTEDELIALAESLVPRAGDSPIPGFDVGPGAPRRVRVVDEAYGPFASGSAVMSGCQLIDGRELSVGTLDFRPLYDAIALLDRPSDEPSPFRQLDDGRVVVVRGVPNQPQLADAALDSVSDATVAEWAAMLLNPGAGELAGAGLPVDEELLDRLAGRTFQRWEEIRDEAVAAITERLPAELSTDAIKVHHYGAWGEIVITVPSVDPSFAATQWSVTYERIANPYVHTIVHAIRCADGTLRPPDGRCAARSVGEG